MKWILAFKCFFKALRDPKKAEQFLYDEPKKITEASDNSHLRLLTYLQDSGRLIDFLQEDISAYSDAQVGAAVRKIHQDCRSILEELVTLRPVRDEKEGSMIQIPIGYNPSEIKLVGKIKGEAPYNGVLVHKGWKVHKRSLPKNVGTTSMDVVFPAEVEIK